MAKDEETAELNPASEGAGPLLQRDYWAVFEGRPELRPPDVAAAVAEHFCSFPPEKLVEFRRTDTHGGRLQPGDELDIDILGVGECGVRVMHCDRNSLTLLTLSEHPEAGRITFGAYPNDDGDVVFHIRSRARASSGLSYLEFLALGEAMQTQTWTDFINALAASLGCTIRGEIHAETEEVADDETDGPWFTDQPTFIARGE